MAQDTKGDQPNTEANMSQLDMKKDGEGNHPSTASSNSTGPKADVQLASQPTVASSQATGNLNGLDLDALLDPAPSGLAPQGNPPSKRAAWLDELFDDNDEDGETPSESSESEDPSPKHEPASTGASQLAMGSNLTFPVIPERRVSIEDGQNRADNSSASTSEGESCHGCKRPLDDPTLPIRGSLPVPRTQEPLPGSMNFGRGSLGLVNQRPIPPRPLATERGYNQVRPSFAERTIDRYNPIDPEDIPRSRTLAIVHSLVHPTHRDTVFEAIFRAQGSPTAAGSVSDRLRDGFERLEARLNSDPVFLRDCFTYLTSRMDPPYNAGGPAHHGVGYVARSAETGGNPADMARSTGPNPQIDQIDPQLGGVETQSVNGRLVRTLAAPAGGSPIGLPGASNIVLTGSIHSVPSIVIPPIPTGARSVRGSRPVVYDAKTRREAENARMYQPPMTEEQAAAQAAAQAGPATKKKKGGNAVNRTNASNAGLGGATAGNTGMAGSIGNAPSAAFDTSGTYGANAGNYPSNGNVSYGVGYNTGNPGNGVYDYNAVPHAIGGYAVNHAGVNGGSGLSNIGLSNTVMLLQNQVASQQDEINYYQRVAQGNPAIDPESIPTPDVEGELAAAQEKSAFLENQLGFYRGRTAIMQGHITFLENELHRRLTQFQYPPPPQ